MSLVQVALLRVRNTNVLGQAVPVATAEHIIAADAALTSSTSASSASTLASASQFTGDQPSNYVWRVAVAGSDPIVIRFAAAPVALATGVGGFLCPANGVYEFGVLAFGDKFSVIQV